MCQTSQFITLTEQKYGQITWCKGCKTFSLTYKCCCASFTEPELTQFNKLLKALKATDYHYEFNGAQHTIIKNPCAHIGFSLTEKDAKNLIKLTSEALAIFQAFKVIYT